MTHAELVKQINESRGPTKLTQKPHNLGSIVDSKLHWLELSRTKMLKELYPNGVKFSLIPSWIITLFDRECSCVECGRQDDEYFNFSEYDLFDGTCQKEQFLIYVFGENVLKTKKNYKADKIINNARQ